MLAFISFLFFHRVISELRGPIGAKFCTMLGSVFNFIIQVQNFRGASPKKFQGPKTCKIWPDFSPLQTLTANISGTDRDIQNRSSTYLPQFLERSAEKSGEHWSTNCGDLDVRSYPPKSTFSEDHISAPRAVSYTHLTLPTKRIV